VKKEIYFSSTGWGNLLVWLGLILLLLGMSFSDDQKYSPLLTLSSQSKGEVLQSSIEGLVQAQLLVPARQVRDFYLTQQGQEWLANNKMEQNLWPEKKTYAQLEVVENGLSLQPKALELLVAKKELLEELHRNQEAGEVQQQIQQIDPTKF
jgi:hypothetical protein